MDAVKLLQRSRARSNRNFGLLGWRPQRQREIGYWIFFPFQPGSLTVVVSPAADGPLGDGAAARDDGGGVGVLGRLYAAAAVPRVVVVVVVVHHVLGGHGLHVGPVPLPLALRARVGAGEEARGGYGRGAGVGCGRQCRRRGVGGRRADDGRRGLFWRLRGAVVITCKKEENKNILDLRSMTMINL